MMLLMPPPVHKWSMGNTNPLQLLPAAGYQPLRRQPPTSSPTPTYNFTTKQPVYLDNASIANFALTELGFLSPRAQTTVWLRHLRRPILPPYNQAAPVTAPATAPEPVPSPETKMAQVSSVELFLLTPSTPRLSTSFYPSSAACAMPVNGNDLDLTPRVNLELRQR